MLDAANMQKIKEHTPGYIHHWIYEEHGRPVMLAARYEIRGEKTYRQFHWTGNEWKAGMPQAPFPFFGLETLKHTSPFGGPIICEGEKCSAVIQQLTWPSLATVLGASNVSNTDFTPLRHFEQFLILRDNDKSGIRFTRSVAVELLRMRRDVKILVCNLAPEIPGGDVIDWIQQKPLFGHKWDGMQPLTTEQGAHVARTLLETINQLAKPIEECPEISFDSTLSLFEGEPRPFHVSLHSVPPFPIEVLPIDVSHYLQICARQFCLPTDFAGTVFLALTAGVIGRSLNLDMRPGQEWSETANVWATLVGNPSSKKSPTYRRISRLITFLEQKAASEHRQAMKEYRERKKAAKDIKEEFDEKEPVMRRYTTDDCTTPKLRELMSCNHRGMILHNDELKGHLEKLDAPGNEEDRSFKMSCWSGKEFFNEDRMTRVGGYHIPVTLTWIGCIPPTALATYLRQAQSHGSGADGFMQRFQMVTFPDVNLRYEISTEVVSTALEERLQKIFIDMDQEALCNPGRIIHFDEAAQQLFDGWQILLENDCRSGRHPTYWESHLGKQPKLLASLCIILHRLIEVCTGRLCGAISVTNLEGAMQLQHYYQEHACRCYDSMESVEVIDAKRILELIKKKRLPMRFKSQDIYRPGLGGLKDAQRVKAALELLRDNNWVALEKIQGHNGKPGEFWVVHPNAHEMKL